MTTDWIKPQMPEPKGLDFGKLPDPKPAQSAHEEPQGLQFKTAPSPPPKPARDEPHGLAFRPAAPPAPSGLPLYEIGRGLVGHVDPNPPAPPPRHPQSPDTGRILGGDPRAPALVLAAKAIDARLADHRLFRNRLEAFLDLKPAEWATWADVDLQVLPRAATKQAEFARKLSLANAIRWADECEQAYKKPPSLLDRLTAPKPEFYQERLTQARDALTEVRVEIDALLSDVRPRLETIAIDALVLQVSTANVTAQADQIMAARRLQSIVAGQQTAAMIVQGLDNLASTTATQAATIGDLLTITIPNWIIARSKA